MYFLIALRKNGTWMVQSRFLKKEEADKYCNLLNGGIGRVLFLECKTVEQNQIKNYGEPGWQRNVKI